MTVEQLMQPRYKVIADYPSNTEHTIGETLYADKDGIFWCYSETGRWRIHPEQYPHIFRKLEWWEDRDEKDMPEYIQYGTGAVYKVTGWNLEGGYALCDRGENYPLWLQKHTKPVTEAEYLTFKNQPQ